MSGVKCGICPNNCVIAANKTGICGARRGDGKTIIPESYGKVTALALDPIEKKPLYHFYPGSKILSLGSYGCNFKCGFCQNYRISTDRGTYQSETFEPKKIAEMSAELSKKGNIGAAYTYNEPLINYEFVCDCAKIISGQNQKNVLVTNGYINRGPLIKLLPFIHAANIDVKSFNPDFYREIGGCLDAVLATVETAVKYCHIEITTLIIPGKNDSKEEMGELSKWLSGISKDIPLHISRFFPAYRYGGTPATPKETVLALAETAKNNLNYVYPGNI